MNLSIASKIFIITAILGTTFLYSVWKKNSISNFEHELILKTLPDLAINKVFEEGQVRVHDLLKDDSNGLLVHFWGTWCGPCEAELPAFLDFASQLKDSKINFLLIAVQDDQKKIIKYLSRYKNLPSNVVFVNDEAGNSLNTFGTAKVPETYVFNKALKTVAKFVGPQDWALKSYHDRVSSLLLNDENSAPYKVESH